MQENIYIVEKNLDYLTFSAKEFIPIDDVIFRKPVEIRPLISNYRQALMFDTGAILQWNEDKPELKKHITLSGSTLAKMSEYGLSDIEILQWALSLNRTRVGRIDLAVTSLRADGSIHGFLPHMAHYYAMRNLCETRLKLDKPVVNKNLEVETTYIGQRAKRQMLRIYDKGVDLGREANRIIRIEMERRGAVAQSVANLAMQGSDYGGIIRKYFDFPTIPDWLEIMSAEPVKGNRMADVERKNNREQDKLWSWLYTSVAPALARALFNDKTDVATNKNADKFASLVAEHFNNLIDTYNQ